jgi:hypothetical protein
MASELEIEIQQHLLQFLNGTAALHEFEDCFSPIAWTLADSPDVSARELAGRICNVIAEASRGDRTLESMKEELASVIPPFARNSSGEPYPYPSVSESYAQTAINEAA